MVFHSDKKKVLYPKLFIGAIEIERVDYFNFLCLQLNHTLKWNEQLGCVSLKILKSTGLLHKLKLEYPTSILKSTLPVESFGTQLSSKCQQFSGDSRFLYQT